MIKSEWENILKGQEIRQSLSRIRQAIKDNENLQLLQDIIRDNEEVLIVLLESEDAKTRKNVALLMGDLEQKIFLEPIWNAYKNEIQRFVKSSYLIAVGKFDYHIYLEDIKAQLEVLKTVELTIENEKHVREEMRELSSLIVHIEGVRAHTFIGWDYSYDIVLIANGNFSELLSDELLGFEPNAKIEAFGAGIRAKVTNLNWMKKVRIYKELLFVIPGMGACPMEPTAVAETIANSSLLAFLKDTHDGIVPYYFRLEMKSKRLLGEKSAFLKKLAIQIEKLSEQKLINSTNNYEFEIRLIEDKQGDCNLMIKLFTLKDRRFTYRKEVTSTSIKPVNAALTVALSKAFMKEDAQVLDPFCGVGTMLIERHKVVQANTMYGIDIQEDAIMKARGNTEMAGQITHYINRDFFDFTHEHLFDEIITDMPFEIAHITEEEVIAIYQKFFDKVPQHIKNGALIILYSHDRDIVKQMIVRTNFKILKEYEISRREGTYVLILRYK